MIASEIKVSYSTSLTDKFRLTNCNDTFKFILSHWDMGIIEFQEQCKIILLNRSNYVLGIHELSKGGITGTVVDIRIILSVALKCNATGIIVVHNHPSGNMKPSEADKNLTSRLKKACDILDISLIDHFIISRNCFFSFTQEGLI